MSLLLVVLASLDTKSDIFKASALKERLLPALVKLSLEAPLSPPLEGPAYWGAALLINKAAVEEVVEEAVNSQLQSLKASGVLLAPEGRLALAQRDATVLAWLTKALTMRGGPKRAMDQAVSFLIGVAGAAVEGAASDNKEDMEGAAAEPSAECVALALHTAECLGLVLRDGPVQVLPPRPSVMRVNPLWRQRLFYLAFPRLRQSIQLHRDRPEAKAAALLAVCNIVAGLPKPIIQSELENILVVIIQVSSRLNGSD